MPKFIKPGNVDIRCRQRDEYGKAFVNLDYLIKGLGINGIKMSSLPAIKTILHQVLKCLLCAEIESDRSRGNAHVNS